MAVPSVAENVDQAALYMSKEDIKQSNLGRENVYAFLSRIFAKEINEEALEAVVSVQPTMALLASSQESEELKDGSRLLQDFVDQAKAFEGDERKKLITDLAVEFADLFLAVGKNRILTCESGYLGKHRLLYRQKPFYEVKEMYGKSGFEKRKDFLEPEDHIAVELDYMANLCRETRLSLEETDLGEALRYVRLQESFITSHLRRWVPEFCERLKRATESKLYKSSAYLTNGFISMEDEVINDLANTVEALSGTKETS